MVEYVAFYNLPESCNLGADSASGSASAVHAPPPPPHIHTYAHTSGHRWKAAHCACTQPSAERTQLSVCLNPMPHTHHCSLPGYAVRVVVQVPQSPHAFRFMACRLADGRAGRDLRLMRQGSKRPSQRAEFSYLQLQQMHRRVIPPGLLGTIPPLAKARQKQENWVQVPQRLWEGDATQHAVPWKGAYHDGAGCPQQVRGLYADACRVFIDREIASHHPAQRGEGEEAPGAG